MPGKESGRPLPVGQGAGRRSAAAGGSCSYFGDRGCTANQENAESCHGRVVGAAVGSGGRDKPSGTRVGCATGCWVKVQREKLRPASNLHGVLIPTPTRRMSGVLITRKGKGEITIRQGSPLRALCSSIPITPLPMLVLPTHIGSAPAEQKRPSRETKRSRKEKPPRFELWNSTQRSRAPTFAWLGLGNTWNGIGTAPSWISDVRCK